MKKFKFDTSQGNQTMWMMPTLHTLWVNRMGYYHQLLFAVL